MINELVLVPRLAYSVLFISIIMFVTGFDAPKDWVKIFLLFFFSTFVWQYLFLHFILKEISPIKWRNFALNLWIISTSVISGWGIYNIGNFFHLDSDMSIKDLINQFTIYSISSEMFTSGVCAQKVFEKYKCLE